MTEHRLAPTFRLISSHLPTYGPGFEGVPVIAACHCGEKRPADGYGGWWAWHVAHALDEAAKPPADTDVTVYIGIGNSDNKLSQQEWARFCAGIDGYIRSVATQFLGEWHSLPNAAWQNAEYAAVVPADRMDDVRTVLGRYRDQYRQDSIALAVVDRTEFI